MEILNFHVFLSFNWTVTIFTLCLLLQTQQTQHHDPVISNSHYSQKLTFFVFLMRENVIGKQELEYSMCCYKNKTTILRQTQHCRCDTLTRSTKRQNTQITQNNTTQNVALANSTIDTFKNTEQTETGFSRLLRHPARKWSGSILTTSEPARGSGLKVDKSSEDKKLHIRKQAVEGIFQKNKSSLQYRWWYSDN